MTTCSALRASPASGGGGGGQKALELLAKMRMEKIEPNEIVYGGIIKACCAGGQAKKVCDATADRDAVQQQHRG